jgi:hypothetical protein
MNWRIIQLIAVLGTLDALPDDLSLQLTNAINKLGYFAQCVNITSYTSAAGGTVTFGIQLGLPTGVSDGTMTTALDNAVLALTLPVGTVASITSTTVSDLAVAPPQ